MKNDVLSGLPFRDSPDPGDAPFACPFVARAAVESVFFRTGLIQGGRVCDDSERTGASRGMDVTGNVPDFH
jgi:hypothetical protein